MRKRLAVNRILIALVFVLAYVILASNSPVWASIPPYPTQTGNDGDERLSPPPTPDTMDGRVPPSPQLSPSESIWQPPGAGTGQKLTAAAAGSPGLLPQTVPLDWIWQNPLPTGNNLWDLHCIGTATCYAVGDSGTIVKTTNGGETWEGLNSGTRRFLLNVYCADMDTCWVVGGAGTILKTTDGGSSWEPQISGTSETLKGMDFVSESTGWIVGGGEIILKTTDGGNSWVRSNDHGGYALLWAVDFVDANTGMAVGWEYANSATLWRTEDGGVTWTDIWWYVEGAGIASGPTNLFCVDARTCWITSAVGGIQRTTDRGDTWINQLHSPVGELYGLYFVDANVGWAVGTANDGTILKTTNGGETWTVQTGVGGRGLNAVYFGDASTGWTVGYAGAVLKTVDSGAAWNPLAPVTLAEVKQVDCVDESTCWALDALGNLLRTVNGGSAWSVVTTNLPKNPDPIDFVDANNGWGIYDSVYPYEVDNVVRTTDGGVTWTKLCPTYLPRDIDFIDTEVGWIVGGEDLPFEGARVFRTTDGGVTCTDRSPGIIATLKHASFVDDLTGWASGDSIVVRTTDGGLSWEDVTPPIQDLHLEAFESVDSEYAWAGTSVGLIRTRDGGASWNVNDPVWYPVSSIRFIDRNLGWATTYGKGTLLRTMDGGDTWTARFVGIPKNQSDIDCVNSQVCWLVGEQGTILYTASGGGEGTQVYPPHRVYLPLVVR